MDDGLRSVLIILVLFFVNGFFAMAEMSVVSARKALLQAKAEEGKSAYRRALKVSENPGPFLSAIQIALTLISIVSGAFGEATLSHILAESYATVPLLAPYAESLGLATVVLGITIVAIVIGELVPKRIALSNPERIASWVIGPVKLVQILFFPFVKLFSAITNVILALFRIKHSEESNVTEEEIRIMLREGRRSGAVEKHEHEMMEGVFSLGDRTIEAFMTHRSEVAWLPVEASLSDIKTFLRIHPRYDSVPVCRDSLDNLVGMVDTQTILRAMMDNQNFRIVDHIQKPLYIPGSLSALKALQLFKNAKSASCLVIDEYGGVEGMVGIQDLLDEILGSVSGNLELAAQVIRRSDGSYLVDGRMDIEEFQGRFGLDLSTNLDVSFHTVAGLVLATAGHIPREGEVFFMDGHTFEIIDMDSNRIDKILYRQPAQAEEELSDD